MMNHIMPKLESVGYIFVADNMYMDLASVGVT